MADSRFEAEKIEDNSWVSFNALKSITVQRNNRMWSCQGETWTEMKVPPKCKDGIKWTT